MYFLDIKKWKIEKHSKDYDYIYIDKITNLLHSARSNNDLDLL